VKRVLMGLITSALVPLVLGSCTSGSTGSASTGSATIEAHADNGLCYFSIPVASEILGSPASIAIKSSHECAYGASGDPTTANSLVIIVGQLDDPSFTCAGSSAGKTLSVPGGCVISGLPSNSGHNTSCGVNVAGTIVGVGYSHESDDPSVDQHMVPACNAIARALES
jgi:hypothetical protein